MPVKRKNMGFVLLIIFYAFILLSIQGNALAQSWLSPDWGYRMRLAINNPSSSNSLTDYQIKVRLNHTNFNFSLAQSKGEDLRFTSSDGITLINHWIEYWNSVAESALVWVKIPSVPALDSAVVYVYYGNPNANNSSNGKGTFEFFDDFESDYLAESGWSIKTPLPLVKADNATAVYNNLLYVFGGYDRDPSCVKYYLDETFVYNPVTDAWTQLADMPTARWGPVAVESNGLIHVFAGESASGLTGIHEIYDPAIDTWRSSALKNPLSVPQYGASGAVHPDVIYFPEGKDGYQYWMIYTPYPPQSLENPSIVRSHDGITWTDAEVTNPVIPLGTSSAWNDLENSDPDFIYVSDYNKWFMVWAGGNAATNSRKIALAYSLDGKNWTEYNGTPVNGNNNPVILSGDDNLSQSWERSTGGVSATSCPTLFYENGTFSLYYVEEASGNNRGRAGFATFTWNNATNSIENLVRNAGNPTINLPQDSYFKSGCGHLDLSKNPKDSLYYMYLVRELTGSSSFELALLTSPDRISWTNRGKVLERGASGQWDDTYIYRSSPVVTSSGNIYYSNDKIRLYYSAFKGGVPGIGIADIPETGPPEKFQGNGPADVPAGLADQGVMGIKYGNKIHLFLKQYHYEYDPATDTYTAKANVPTPRSWGTCALVDGLIYVIGGYSYGSPSGATDVNEVYDPATDTWTTKAPMPVKKYGATRENPVIGGKIYVTHGRDGSYFLNKNYAYDPSTDTWLKKSSGVNPRDGVGCGVINNKLYVLGGRDIFSCAVGRNYVEEYDPANDKGEVWVLSDINVSKRDTLAKYEQAYGFLFNKSFSGDGISAQHYQNFITCAVDIYWNITDYWGLAYSQPEGAIALTNNESDGSLSFFNNNGRPEFSWYRSSYKFLQTGTWNTWYPVTIIWNGSNSKVIINGTEYPVSAANTNSNRVFLRVNKITREYFDLVRVRKYSSPEPGVILGPVESSNHPPVLTLQDTTFFLCEPETVSFNLSATDIDADDTLTIEKLLGPGDYTPQTGPSPLNSTHSFLPGAFDTTYLFVFKVTDIKGAFFEESSYVQIHLNHNPILTLPVNIDTLLCNSGDSLYLPITGEDADTGDTLALEKLSSPGTLLPANPVYGTSPLSTHFLWKPDYSDTSGNPHRIIFKLKDLCGKEVQDTLLISVKFDHPPVLTLPADTSYNLCKADTICFGHISATDSDSGDSVFIQKLSGSGEYNPGSGSCCFLPSSKDSTYSFIFQAQDLCGTSALDTFNLTVHLNRTPALSLPSDTFYKLCAPGDSILFQVSASDPGDSLNLTKLSTEGELRPQDPISGEDSVKGIFVWKPDYPDTLSNPHLLIFQVTDNCGISQTDTVQIWIELNHPPVLTSEDSSYALCEDSTVCFNHLIGKDSDPDDSLSLELISGPSCLFLTTVINPTSVVGFTCFLTSGDSVYTFIFELKDKCGAKAVDTVYIEITPPANLLRGDPNGDALVTVSDVIYIINYLFKSGPPPTNCSKSGDINCDSKITVSDVVYLISYLFKGGPPPCP
jgi:N-acetylneuraminic acid mutarotase